MLDLDSHPLGQVAFKSGSGSGVKAGLRSILQMEPALKMVQFFTSHLPSGFIVEITAQPPSWAETHTGLKFKLNQP